MTASIAQTLWDSRIALHITHPSSRIPFVASVPRFSYLALLLPRLSAFFRSTCSSFHFEDVQLRNLPVGLLDDDPGDRGGGAPLDRDVAGGAVRGPEGGRLHAAPPGNVMA